MEKTQFINLNLSDAILKAVQEMGFEEATVIQTAAIPLILSGKDVIGHSQTGTGKTAAFAIPAIEMIDTSNHKVQVLILCPTRELALQACEEVRKFSKYKHGVKTVPIYGGQPIDRQIMALKSSVQIVIGTPGRIMDHMRRKTLKFDHLKMVILDEADEMLNMGFREDIETILSEVPTERQTVLFSATMSPEILSITHLYQNNPELIKVIHKQLTVPSVEQFYYEVSPSKKTELLSRLIDIYNPRLSLVFCNTKRQVDELVTQMQLRGYMADGLHGDLRQTARTKVMDMFRRGKIDVLIATDVAARGIDIDDIDAVFNYDIPQDEEYYVHRIGRTGRAGRDGRAFTFVSGRMQIFQLRDIQKYTNSKIILQAIPTSDEVEENKTNKLVSQIKSVLDAGALNDYAKIIDKLMDEDYSSVDIASALLKIMVGNQNEEKVVPSKYDFEESTNENGMVRFFINIGRSQKICAKDILGAITVEAGIDGKSVGIIDIFESYSFVEVKKEDAAIVMDAMKNGKIKGIKINIEPSKAKQR
jgi:ATP-dependent RNA helicase DeaD